MGRIAAAALVATWLGALWPGPAWAEAPEAPLPADEAAEPEAEAPEEVPIPVEDWREMTAGRVVWYSIEGRHWGREYYDPERDRAVFVGADGTCLSGGWAAQDGVYCFAYAGLHCFRHVRRGARIVILPVPDGVEQTVERITDDGPLACTPPLTM